MTTLFTDDPYKTLGIEPSATQAEVKQAYFTLVREHPPERDPEGFKRIRAAYEKVKSAGERAETDLFRVDDQAITSEAIRKHAAEPPQITLDRIKADLLALEVFLLLEELRASR
jgi:curved DNA-binding protein CbpA